MYFPCFCWHCLPRFKCSVADFLLLSYCSLCCMSVELNIMQLSTHLSSYCLVLADYMHPPVYPLTAAHSVPHGSDVPEVVLFCSEYIHIALYCCNQCSHGDVTSTARNIHGEVMRRAKRGVEIEEESEERPRAERERFGAPATRRAERDGSSWCEWSDTGIRLPGIKFACGAPAREFHSGRFREST